MFLAAEVLLMIGGTNVLAIDVLAIRAAEPGQDRLHSRLVQPMWQEFVDKFPQGHQGSQAYGIA